MKKILLLLALTSAGIMLYQCKKSATATLPSLTTLLVTGITPSSASAGGDIISNGNADITARGVCWSTSPEPTVTDNKTMDGSGSGQFMSSLTGMIAGTVYYVRAYATNSTGTAYGNQVTFTTAAAQIPSLTTSAISAISSTTATSGGNITNDGGEYIIARGVCWSMSSGATKSGSHTTDGVGTGSFMSSLSGLTANTMYYVKAYATNSVGTGYGNEVTFTTTNAQAANTISIQGMAFVPAALTIPVNTTVKWTNNDAVAHTVTSDTGAFDSGGITSGGSYSHQFTSAGTFNYHCAYHPYMMGTITVQ